jgi:hypothetical protein
MRNDNIVLTDGRGNKLTHSVLAERLIQAETMRIVEEMHYHKGCSDTLTFILEGGFKGFHNMSNERLCSEWEDYEEEWFANYDREYLPCPAHEDDPILTQQTGEQ